ncbi:MAG: FHA domain-containing protein [Myxococcales bacterium]|jgi:hypothetical protein
MAFSLTILEGKELGRQYTFDQPVVSIGRTADNDIVLYDAGVSRKHAIIRDEGGRFFVKDLGSANGTQVNGNATTEEELQSGDEIALGPVVLTFEAIASDDGSTRILDTSSLAPSPRKRPMADPAEAGRKTTAMAVRRPRTPSAGPRSRSTALAKPGAGPTGLAKPSAAPERPLPAPSGAHKRPVPVARVAKGPYALSASERARVLRENSKLVGRVKLFLLEKPPAVRKAMLGGAGLLAVLLLALIVKLVLPKGEQSYAVSDVSKTVFPLAEPQEEKVFGFGDHLGVTVPTRNELHFEFEHSDTIPIVYYISFESQGVERQDEVDITLNGVLIGKVAPGLGDYSKEQRIKLPRKHLKSGIPNEIVFDNSFNPPGNEPWAISKVRLKMVPLPGCNPEGECEREAKKHYDLAIVLWEQRKIAARNAFDAWEHLHKSLLFLEAVEPKPGLYNIVQTKLRDAERELDGNCAKILLNAKKFEELGQWERALKEYKDGLQWFPGEDHSCRATLEDKILEYG